jgi:hypothetical protein
MDYKKGMRVPGVIFASAQMIEQIKKHVILDAA